jgi:hypothetical protein
MSAIRDCAVRKITNKHKLTVANVFLFLILALNDVTEISSGEQLPSRKSKSVRAIFINTCRDGRLPVCRQPKRESSETDSFFFSFFCFLRGKEKLLMAKQFICQEKPASFLSPIWNDVVRVFPCLGGQSST